MQKIKPRSSSKVKKLRAEVYKENDYILPILGLDSKESVSISIQITDNDVVLQVDRRDWLWSRKTGELLGAGTLFV